MYFELFSKLLERIVLLMACLFLITRIQGFRDIFQKQTYKAKDYLIIGSIFSIFSIISNYTALSVDGSYANIRTITIVSGGVLFGPVIGIVTGLISGIHRYLIDVGGVTSLPCLISSICAGVISGFIYNKVEKRYRWIAGIAAGIFSETITMILIWTLSQPHALGVDIVSKIGFPMIAAQVSVGVLVWFVQNVEDDKERIAALQAKLALDIANKTLPYFRQINSESLNKVCSIIRQEIQSDAVSITDTKYIVAYSGLGEEFYNVKHEIITPETYHAIETGEIVIRNHHYSEKTDLLKSAIIIPLKVENKVTGTLKIYYKTPNKVTYTVQALAVGLSQIISTLMEVSRVEEMKQMAGKAELKALQTQINPHFLFNALNAIASSIRLDPNRARELIINLSEYLRFNLELNSEFIDIHSELKQVQAYIEIEKARFGDKLSVNYDIDDVKVQIPSLILQPLVENAIVHGILKKKSNGHLRISVKDAGDRVHFCVEDDGVGIDQAVLEHLAEDKALQNKIGLYNVHKRLKLIYGSGLMIQHLTPGTRVEFFVSKEIKDERNYC